MKEEVKIKKAFLSPRGYANPLESHV